MAEKRGVVFKQASERTHLPEWASPGAVMLELLRVGGRLAELGRRLRVYREGGYVGLDMFVFFALYFMTGSLAGVRKFSKRAQPVHRLLAALAGRDRLPSPSSISRFLGVVTVEAVTSCASWLLLEAPDVKAVLRHASVQTRDALGQGWHVFDWDPTVTTLRRRGLPSFEDMPAGRRRSEDTAAPGYGGRKRGQVQFSRAMLQHAGSGLWLDMHLSPGNGDFRAAITSALAAVGRACEIADAPLDRALLRVDGAAGHVPFITACQEAGVHYVTRLAHYELLNRPEIRAHLDRALWFQVPSSGSGPERQAVDLGIVMLRPAATTQQDDGTPYEPVETRVVVSRFPIGKHERGAGYTIDGWRYELYATSLEAPAWPAPEIASEYYGRIAIENRLAQEDRGLGLDHIFSYHLPGQALASLFGLFTWNYQICRGMELLKPPADRLPAQPFAAPEVAEPPPGPMGSSTPSKPEPNAPHQPEPVCDAADDLAPSDGARETPAVTVAAAALLTASTLVTAPTSEPLTTLSPREARAECDAMVAALDWPSRLDGRPGWFWDDAESGIRCPNGALLVLRKLEEQSETRTRMRFGAARGACSGCAQRSDCIQSSRSDGDKQLSQKLNRDDAHRLRSLVSLARLAGPLAKPVDEGPTRRREPSRSTPSKGHIWHPPPPVNACGLFAVAAAPLLPGVLRNHMVDVCEHVETRVERGPGTRAKPIAAYAASAARRQRRRLTWPERDLWNKLPPDTSLSITFSNAGPLAALHEIASLRPDDNWPTG